MDQLIGHFRIAPGLCSKARRDGRSLIWKWSFISVADPGEGSGGPNPPLIFRPNGGPNGRNFFFLGGGGGNFFFLRPPPPHISGSWWPLPPLSEGLNPPLYFHANKTHFHMKSFALSLVLKVRVFGIRKWPIMHRKRREIWMVYQHCPQDFPWENGRGERALGTRMLSTHLGGSDGKRIHVA